MRHRHAEAQGDDRAEILDAMATAAQRGDEALHRRNATGPGVAAHAPCPVMDGRIQDFAVHRA